MAKKKILVTGIRNPLFPSLAFSLLVIACQLPVLPFPSFFY